MSMLKALIIRRGRSGRVVMMGLVGKGSRGWKSSAAADVKKAGEK